MISLSITNAELKDNYSHKRNVREIQDGLYAQYLTSIAQFFRYLGKLYNKHGSELLTAALVSSNSAN